MIERILDENLSRKREDYHVITDDKNLTDKELANQAVTKLFQQTIFLNIGLDIQKKSEIKMAIMKDRFHTNYSELVAQIEQQKDFLNSALQHAGLNDSGKKRVTEILNALKQTEERLAAAKTRPLRIAAMGTKKAGKSVVIYTSEVQKSVNRVLNYISDKLEDLDYKNHWFSDSSAKTA